MHLEELKLVDFKNYQEWSAQFHPKINCIVGPNGVGKTNILDAIYLLSFTKSYLNNVDSQLIHHGKEFFVVEGAYIRKEEKERIYCGFKKGQRKKLMRNKKEYERISEHIGLLPLVMISPYDRNLILEGSEIRRKFMDGVIAQFDKSFLDHLIRYNKNLAQRNTLLKYFAANRKFDRDTLEVYDMQLEEHGAYIHNARAEFMVDFQPLFQKLYADIADEKEAVSIEYRSQLKDKTTTELLREALQKDKVLQFTSVGAHKDDLKFKLDGYPLKKTGSQGQQKTFLIALKLAQFEFLSRLNGFKPLLLLDDIFDKLDSHRVRAIIEMVNDHRFGQIFITDTHPERTEQLVKEVNEESAVISIESFSDEK
jgi:DNA replication and repair protein RecF